MPLAWNPRQGSYFLIDHSSNYRLLPAPSGGVSGSGAAAVGSVTLGIEGIDIEWPNADVNVPKSMLFTTPSPAWTSR
ncbi:MAG TPA: hypothetical protein VHX86_09930 [Tepidisphaeraceae bacterium]|jgi:hypothetical protein|nr:hypothetical protein [Tepidisphaeraceae bacterium]